MEKYLVLLKPDMPCDLLMTMDDLPFAHRNGGVDWGVGTEEHGGGGRTGRRGWGGN